MMFVRTRLRLRMRTLKMLRMLRMMEMLNNRASSQARIMAGADRHR